MKYSYRYLVFVFLVATAAFAQENRIRYNNQNLFLGGANLAWLSFAKDIGPGFTDFNSFADILLQMHDHGGNALRWWLHTNGTITPEFNEAGYVVGPGQGTIEDLKKVLDLAWEREVGLILCLWSFDMLRRSNSPIVLNRNRWLLNDTSYTRAYIDNALIPMVDSLKGHPAIIAWEIFNEPEGMSNEFGWSDIQHVPMVSIQRFINLCAGAIHRTDPAALVTNGAVNFKTLTDVPTTSFPQIGKVSLTTEQIMLHHRQTASTANYNYYSDSRLIAAGGDSLGTLDFYSVHYYTSDPPNPAVDMPISPFHHPASYWLLDKPIVVAEFHIKETLGVPKDRLFEVLYSGGYAGALPWSWTDKTFSTQEDMLAAMQYMWDHHRADVDVNGIGGDWPVVTITSPANDAQFPDSAEVTITAEASDKDGSVVLVEFFANDTLRIGERSIAPYSITWKNIPADIYTLTAVATDNQGHQRTSNRVRIKVGTLTMARLEAERATRQGDVLNMIVSNNPHASNGAYLDIRTQNGRITWTLPAVPAAGSYELAFGYRLSYDTPKDQYINVNGTRVATLRFDGAMNVWLEKKLRVNLVQGNNTIQMELYWGWMDLDYLAVPSSIVSAVKTPFKPPVIFSLRQNYPNPFNPVTNITYSLAKPEQVKLAVYDLSGRQVRVLVDEKQLAGSYRIAFEAKNLASGLYFYRLQAGSLVDEKRMVLVK
ncbi:MAG: Ig-like domain-containing protein [candidate division KSB1 bacterium]|nr:Ig-like domain-containing protein [candidate division KSB1 bacterium]MDZ7304182.1 Ig-like domain-containing protein [candidate division KSB1 bacterium]MDZ7310654.1 Ig-like domain-containing protein [candidate division KSB1 bacterium]